MGSSVILNVPSPPSSSSSSSSWSSRIHQAAENEGEDRAGMGGKLSDRNRFSKRLGHRVPRLARDDVKNGRTLNSLNRGAEESDNGDNQLNLEIETLERKVLMMMIAKGLKGDELGKFADDEEILKAMKLKDKLKDLGIGAEDRRKKSGKGMVLKPEIRRRKANPNTKKGSHSQQIEKTGKMIHEAMNASDDNGEKDEKKLSKEIEVLEAMLERGRYGLLDMQMMMEEVKAMKGSEKMENEIKEKMTELESELREVKNAIVALKRKKIKELKSRIQKEEENEMKYEEQEEQQEQEEYDEEEESKINWGSVVASLGAVAVAAAAVFLMGRSSSKMEFKSEKNRRQNEPR
ncbi:hypothetical protein HRI_001441400 [Hibiscus trionum]|uniref:Uncharacterized protein n=1 Tax=Hibiscus trionum TaxID=183268 RepID=A0A9W7LVS3_HIBTR|nr:hypothetical protein HRI_001441400 [Hibiscus trionum]